jgi:protein-L-isoaspartate O-methyltransferase
MNLVRRLIKGDHTRKSRFHTSNGHLCLKPLEFLLAFGTTVNRIAFHTYSRQPWLVFSAVKYLAANISSRRVFEFGSGMSTLWFAERCAQVVSVESNAVWYNDIRQRSTSLPNVQIIYADTKEDYLRAIASDSGKFDLIVIDGLYRGECAALARRYLSRDGLIVVDNTDKFPDLAAKVKYLFSDSEVRFFRGWTPGNLHPYPSETSIIKRIPV